MIDRREAIAARLLAIAQGIPGVTEAVRNRKDVTAKTGPRIVIWDGDEEVVREPGQGRLMAKGVGASVMVEMTPEIRILAEATAPAVGTQINALRAALLAAIIADARFANRGAGGSLADLINAGPQESGDCRYKGCLTTIERGQRIEGEVHLHFAIAYPLIQAELT